METEWLDFGHKFADRCGHGENSEDLNERCPVFLQWLDCVHQLQRQFPCSLEFNEAFLVSTSRRTAWLIVQYIHLSIYWGILLAEMGVSAHVCFITIPQCLVQVVFQVTVN